MVPELEIVPTRLHWLTSAPATDDLCVHGGLRVVVGDNVLLEGADTDYALSTGALHLMRTLERGHTKDDPIAEHLVPHCGHFMVVSEESGEVVNLGCPSGVNWWVRHRGRSIELEFEDGNRLEISRESWCRAVFGLVDRISEFVAASPPKAPTPDDIHWYEAFCDEWSRRRGTNTRAV